ncbi:hypothetical protein [Bacillus atrophaeus]|uniref:hypothetical protein n=1 Tax=Bacillus atrophaeus TaxID=1452 RepID=UPI002E21F9DE|nr:hypothetical protein [Bacillus atrophaeus]
MPPEESKLFNGTDVIWTINGEVIDKFQFVQGCIKVNVGLKYVAKFALIHKKTGEVTCATGYKEDEEIQKLIKIRNRMKKKRIRKKINKKIEGLLT